jgi:putative nucleotidyltransferase with HDIG domain
MAIPSSSYITPNNRGEYEYKPADDRSIENGPPAFDHVQDPWSQAKLREIYRFSRQLFASNSIDLLLQEVVRETKEILEISFCRVLLPKTDGTWVCEAVFPEESRARRRFKLPETGLAQFIYQRAAEKAIPTLLHRGSSLWNTLEQQTSHISRATWLCLVPLVFGGETLGLLELGQNTKNQTTAFDEEKNQLAAFIAEQAAGAIYRIRVANRLQTSQSETVLALSKTLETRDDHTAGHCNRMTALAERTAAACHCTDDEVQLIRWAGMLHDIGKVGIPDDILRRPGPLNNSEWALIQRHPDVGADIVLMVSNLSQVADLIRSHHERFDGKGYPRGLRGSQIPLGGRILAIADAYTAMTDGRVYRPPVSHADAISELKHCAGTHFDPRIIEVFVGLFQ